MNSLNRLERRKAWETITRDAILGAVVRVLGRNGVDGLTMETVAHEAGVAKGTLYTYFKDKEDLLKSTMEISLAPMRQKLFSLLESNLSPTEKVQKFVAAHLGFFHEHQQLFRILLYDRHFLPNRYRRFGNERYQALVQKLAGVLKMGMSKREFKVMDPIKLAGMLVESDISMIHQRLIDESPAPLQEDCQMITRVFFNGIVADQKSEK